MSGESARILITGSDMVGISSYVKLLQMEGHEVHTAFNGADLLELLAKYNFEHDLIITDIRIPGLSSYELGDYIAMNSGNDIPIIGIADFARDEQILMDSGESFTLIIEKGFTAGELIEAVSSIVNFDALQNNVLTDQQSQNRAQQLSESADDNDSDYVESAQNFVQNRGHQDLIDKFKNM
jgi:CheY-like chemotaxis protein